MQIETLESRRLMSAVTFSLDAASGLLTASGTGTDDVVKITKSGEQLLVIHKTRPAGQNVSEASVPYSFKTFPASKVKQILMKGYQGNDQLEVENNVKVDATLDSGTGTAGGWANTLRGGGGNDTLYVRGTTVNATVDGRNGNDTIVLQDRAQNVNGSDGDDTIVDQASPVVHQGYAPDDWINYTGGAGKDTIDFSAHTQGMFLCNAPAVNGFQLSGFFLDTPAGPYQTQTFEVHGFETFAGTQGDDVIHGDKFDNTLKGNGGDDELYGADGNDSLFGGKGDDFVKGGNGNDVLVGQAGYDSLFGEAGSDTLHAAGDGASDIVSGGTGRDAAADDDNDFVTGVEAEAVTYLAGL